ncbi:MAG TPA: PilZ domain-containing protein [Terriglobales bacterium]|nr:PilZ domain-containing protein [Terriglobales bacterium]
MANFPNPHGQVRAPRVHISNPKPVRLAVEGRRLQGLLLKVSLTGGLVELAKPISDGSFGEVVLDSADGPIRGLIEFLRPDRKTTAQGFRFVALEDEDHHRLSHMLRGMRSS